MKFKLNQASCISSGNLTALCIPSWGVQGILGLWLTMHRWSTILPLPVTLPSTFVKLSLGFPGEASVSPSHELVFLGAFIPTSLFPQLHPHIKLNPSPFSFPDFTRGECPGSLSLFHLLLLPRTQASDTQAVLMAECLLSVTLGKNDDLGGSGVTLIMGQYETRNNQG